MKSPSHVSSVALLSLGFISSASAAISSIDDFSTEWTRINYANNGLADPIADSNGQDSEELVGNAILPFFFTDYNDLDDGDSSNDVMSFRTRHAETKNGGTDFTSNLFIGIDADGDFIIDAFVGVNTSGSSEQIFIANPAFSKQKTNTSVSSSQLDTNYVATPVITASNFNWRAVADADTLGSGESLDIDNGGNTDFYLSFQINFETLAAVLQNNSAAVGDIVTKNTGLRFVVGTSTQNNSFNKDIGGLDGNTEFGTSFSELPDITSVLTSADGQVIPEPSTSALLAGSMLAFIGRRRRRN